MKFSNISTNTNAAANSIKSLLSCEANIFVCFKASPIEKSINLQVNSCSLRWNVIQCCEVSSAMETISKNQRSKANELKIPVWMVVRVLYSFSSVYIRIGLPSIHQLCGTHWLIAKRCALVYKRRDYILCMCLCTVSERGFWCGLVVITKTCAPNVNTVDKSREEGSAWTAHGLSFSNMYLFRFIPNKENSRVLDPPMNKCICHTYHNHAHMNTRDSSIWIDEGRIENEMETNAQRHSQREWINRNSFACCKPNSKSKIIL